MCLKPSKPEKVSGKSIPREEESALVIDLTGDDFTQQMTTMAHNQVAKGRSLRQIRRERRSSPPRKVRRKYNSKEVDDEVIVVDSNDAFAEIQYSQDHWLALKLQRDLERQDNAMKRKAEETLKEDLFRAKQLQEEEEGKARDAQKSVEETFDVMLEYRTSIYNFLQDPKSTMDKYYLTKIEENQHAQVGTHLYNRLVEAWQEFSFHGTVACNVLSICTNGLDPSKRRRQAHGMGDYFGQDAQTSLRYSGQSAERKAIVMPVIMDKSGLTTQKHVPATNENIIVVHNPAHQLPLLW